MKNSLKHSFSQSDTRHFLALEVKNPETGGRIGPKQTEELEAIRQAGGVAEVIASWEDLKRIIARSEPMQKLIGYQSDTQ